MHVLDGDDALIRNDVHKTAKSHNIGIFFGTKHGTSLAAITKILLVLSKRPTFAARVVPVVELLWVLPRAEDFFGRGFKDAFYNDGCMSYLCMAHCFSLVGDSFA